MSNPGSQGLDMLARARPHLLPPDAGVDPLAPEGLALATDPDGVVTWCSTAVESLTGRSSTALVARPLPLELFDRDELERRAAAAGVPVGLGLFLLDPACFDRRRGGGPDLGDSDRRRSPEGRTRRSQRSRDASAKGCLWNVTGGDGTTRVISLTVRPRHDRLGSLLGYFARATDVTEEHRTSTLLSQALVREQEATRRLAELDQLRNDFVVTAGHELRTPLTSVLGFLELLEGGIDDPVRRSEVLSVIRRNVVRLQELADGLATLSDANAHLARSASPVDLRDVLDAVRAELHQDGETSRVTPTYDISEHPVEVLGNGSRLQVAMRSLVENAVKFTPAGGRVACRLMMSPAGATFEVSDTGPGIPSAELPHLLLPFFRGASARELCLPGSGVGLSIAAAVVEEHGGQLLVSQSEPHGSVFSLHLPHTSGRSL